jgi:hypothetical protein
MIFILKNFAVLVIPGQSISADKANHARTKRNLTLKELLAHLRHHNVSARKDGLLGLLEIVQTHENVLDHHLGTILESVAQAMLDEVRDFLQLLAIIIKLVIVYLYILQNIGKICQESFVRHYRATFGKY